MTAEEFAAMERLARMFEAANEKMLTDNKRLREENARLREAVKAAYYEGWQDRESIIATGERLDFDWNCSEARYAIREGAG